jgi:hypothetical protein
MSGTFIDPQTMDAGQDDLGLMGTLCAIKIKGAKVPGLHLPNQCEVLN